MIVMKDIRTIITENGIAMNIHTHYDFVELVDASEYEEDAEGLRILWWNPYVCNGESQLDSEVFPLTIGGLMRLTREAKALNNQIRREVEDNTFTFR